MIQKIRQTLVQLLGSNAPFLVHHVMDLIDDFDFKLLFYNSFLKKSLNFTIVFNDMYSSGETSWRHFHDIILFLKKNYA